MIDVSRKIESTGPAEDLFAEHLELIHWQRTGAIGHGPQPKRGCELGEHPVPEFDRISNGLHPSIVGCPKDSNPRNSGPWYFPGPSVWRLCQTHGRQNKRDARNERPTTDLNRHP